MQICEAARHPNVDFGNKDEHTSGCKLETKKHSIVKNDNEKAWLTKRNGLTATKIGPMYLKKCLFYREEHLNELRVDVAIVETLS